MKQTLTNLFKNYGDVLDVVAHRNLRMRGQAFVSFADAEIAKKAQKEVNRFPLYSKAMVSPSSPKSPGLAAHMSAANLICENAIRCCREEAR